MMEVSEISEKIRQLRKKHALTLDQMAEKTGLSKGYLSKIENAKNEHFPPFSTLSRIANALAVKVAWLLTDDEESEAKYFILRKAERMPIVMKSGSTLFTKWPLANGKPGRNLNPSLMEIPFKHQQIYHHDGEEFYFILEGKLKFTYGKKEFVLKEGDSLYFDTDVPHTAYSLGKKKALALAIGFNEYGEHKEHFAQQRPPYK